MQPTERHVLLFNKLIGYLAKRNIQSLSEPELLSEYHTQQVDLLILLGNSSLYVTEQAALAYQKGLAKELMICGGIGHSTHFLEENIRQHSRYKDVAAGDRPEADMLRDVVVKHLEIDPAAIILENKSTNCGGNAQEASAVLEHLDKHPKTILLLQDPVLQRRTQASFEKVWQEQPDVRFISYAAFIPCLELQEGLLAYANAAHQEFCGIERLLSLVLGEIPRLRNNATGYGPKGKGFITAVEIPEEIEAAYDELAALYTEYVRI